LTTDQRKRLIEMLSLIRPWLEARAAPVTSAPPQPFDSTEGKVAAPPAPSSTLKPTHLPPAQPAAASSAAAQKPTPKADDARPAALGIVGQIDSILQARLVGTPLEGRGIYLSNSPEGGVIVNVGLQKFNGIEEVPDPEIKAALRAAITEWENKYTPGL
jgi:hypothetical protein